ncbi:unnamed protein product [Polarella glacialis]|uniref:Ricin B lectin domain-containing protein n=1 Tax=Polarella glacialis TaxID=89957 RepID=A0A813FT75_POLGL|nr:unnamed protein product [Polarella glacialis]CAE8678681.1 unnamed protein product [Polarella glacialis]
MARLVVFRAVAVGILGWSFAEATPSGFNATGFDPNNSSQLVLATKLVDDANETDYCLDIPGCCNQSAAMTQSPLMAHTCKAAGTSSITDWQQDQIWTVNSPTSGMVRWKAAPSYCLQASNASEGAEIYLQTCATSSVLQIFFWNSSSQQVTLSNKSSLCWVVGSSWKASTRSSADHVRTLRLEACDGVADQYKQFSIPGNALGSVAAPPAATTVTTTKTTTRRGVGFISHALGGKASKWGICLLLPVLSWV